MKLNSDQQQRWEQQLTGLLAYKERFGHCKVPRLWPEDPQLGEWVATQRRSRNRRQLQPDRIYQLDRLGFKWRLAALSKPAMRPLPKDLAALNRRWDKQLAEWRLADQLLP